MAFASTSRIEIPPELDLQVFDKSKFVVWLTPPQENAFMSTLLRED
jgi:hypothetical protein